MVWIGVMLGLGAATMQSLSYLFSRLFVMKRAQGSFHLMVQAHVLMGLASLALLPLAWPAGAPPLAQYFWPMVGAGGFYMLGQVGLFGALRYTEASRVSPLLGLKLIILAAFTVIFQDARMALVQWLAVMGAVAAAFLLNYAGRALPWRAIVWILFACLNYSLSDLSIVAMVQAMALPSPVAAAMLGTAVTYIFCGLVGALLLPWARPIRLADLKYSAPFAACWLGAMFLLFGSFASIGVVFGNIMQSLRGLLSIFIGARLARMGHVQLEQRQPASVLARRILAGGLMLGAIVLYLLNKV